MSYLSQIILVLTDSFSVVTVVFEHSALSLVVSVLSVERSNQILITYSKFLVAPGFWDWDWFCLILDCEGDLRRLVEKICRSCYDSNVRSIVSWYWSLPLSSDSIWKSAFTEPSKQELTASIILSVNIRKSVFTNTYCKELFSSFF